MSVANLYKWGLSDTRGRSDSRQMLHVDRFMNAVYGVAPDVYFSLAETVYPSFLELAGQGLWMMPYGVLAHTLDVFPEVYPYHDALVGWQERWYVIGESIFSYVWNAQAAWQAEPSLHGQPVGYVERLYAEQPLKLKRGPKPQSLESFEEQVYKVFREPGASESLTMRLARYLYESKGLPKIIQELWSGR